MHPVNVQVTQVPYPIHQTNGRRSLCWGTCNGVRYPYKRHGKARVPNCHEEHRNVARADIHRRESDDETQDSTPPPARNMKETFPGTVSVPCIHAA